MELLNGLSSIIYDELTNTDGLNLREKVNHYAALALPALTAQYLIYTEIFKGDLAKDDLYTTAGKITLTVLVNIPVLPIELVIGGGLNYFSKGIERFKDKTRDYLSNRTINNKSDLANKF